jgi:hypothetical protein
MNNKRFYHISYALMEWSDDDNRPYVVGIYIPAFMSAAINPETGRDTAEEAAEEWVKTGTLEGGAIDSMKPKGEA